MALNILEVPHLLITKSKTLPEDLLDHILVRHFAAIKKSIPGIPGVISVSTLTKALRIPWDKKRGEKLVIANFLLDALVTKDKM